MTGRLKGVQENAWERNFIGPDAAEQAFSHLEEYHGISPGVASEDCMKSRQRTALDQRITSFS